jgi:stress response protein YsnF
VSTRTFRADALYGKTVYSSDGEKLGKVDDVLVDDQDEPIFVETKKGLFSGKRHVVPVSGMSADGDDLTVAYTKEQLESAPAFDPDDEVDYERERQLGAHYGTQVRDWDDARDAWRGEDLSRGPTPETRHPRGGLDDTRDTTQGPTPETRQTMRATEDDTRASGQPEADRRTRGDVGGTQDEPVYDAPGRAGDDDAMTRSEEELRVGTRAVEAGRVCLRKWIETEPASETVTTRRQTARVEREPITDANVDEATSGPELSEQEHEVTLTAEEAVAEKRTVPKERVRLETDTVTEEQTVSDEIRKERIEVEGDVDAEGDKRRRKR